MKFCNFGSFIRLFHFGSTVDHDKHITCLLKVFIVVSDPVVAMNVGKSVYVVLDHIVTVNRCLGCIAAGHILRGNASSSVDLINCLFWLVFAARLSV